MEGILFLPNVKAERRNGLVRHVQLVAHAVTSNRIGSSALLGSVFI